jgi:hypothetical protein
VTSVVGRLPVVISFVLPHAIAPVERLGRYPGRIQSVQVPTSSSHVCHMAQRYCRQSRKNRRR